MALATHPDKGGSAPAFNRVMRSFQMLFGLAVGGCALSAHAGVQKERVHKPGTKNTGKARRRKAEGRTKTARRSRTTQAPHYVNASSQGNSPPASMASGEKPRLKRLRRLCDVQEKSMDEIELALTGNSCSESEDIPAFALEDISDRGRLAVTCKGEPGPEISRMPLRSARSTSGMLGIYKLKSKSSERYYSKMLCRHLGMRMPLRDTLEKAILDHMILIEVSRLHEMHWAEMKTLDSAESLQACIRRNLEEVWQAFDVNPKDHMMGFHWRSNKKVELGVQIPVMSPQTRSLTVLAEHFFKLRPHEPIKDWRAFCDTYLAMRGGGDTGGSAIRKLESVLLRKQRIRDAKRAKTKARWPTVRPWTQRFANLQSWLALHSNRYPRPGSKDLWESDMARWVTRQREMLLAGAMRPERRLKLESLPSWRWRKLADRRSWDGHFVRLRSWLTSSSGRFPSRQAASCQERSIASWIHNQMAAHQGQDRGRRPLSKEQVERLEGLHGWKWSSSSQSRSRHTTH